MQIVWSLIVGLVIGVIAKLVMPGRDRGGAFLTASLGLAGSLLAVFIGRVLGAYGAAAVRPGIFASVMGAMLVLAAYAAVSGRRLG
jgi:uncharacterized membrane protein YeaQ/YmgE (transglycosylase-associated protein family)